jgi:hypothetical protein
MYIVGNRDQKGSNAQYQHDQPTPKLGQTELRNQASLE